MADEDLDALVRRVDPDRWLASRFIADRGRRADVVAIYAFDHELARARTVASNALIAEIRLAWWRETLEEIYGGQMVRAHPAAVALAGAVGRRALPRAPLQAMIDARIMALQSGPMSSDNAAIWADEVGGSAAVLASRILAPGTPAEVARPAGRAWGWLMLRRSGIETVGDLDARLREALAVARAASKQVPADVFPAIAATALARAEFTGRARSALGARVRLLLAVLSGGI